mmetsp:Transcript_16311/g.32831  ORF Transcript_16311/g.32831 Transcript_16311/m.32831 type:complete len:85 (+) Transcript_16311:457-711(+)
MGGVVFLENPPSRRADSVHCARRQYISGCEAYCSLWDLDTIEFTELRGLRDTIWDQCMRSAIRWSRHFGTGWGGVGWPKNDQAY